MNPLWIRFWAKVSRQDDGCWLWTGARKPNGYGFIADDAQPGRMPKTLSVHRVSYEWANGEIPEGMQIHHTCENKSCVNPDHLTAKTPGKHKHDHAVSRIPDLLDKLESP